MTKPRTIVLTVAGYTLIELALLMSLAQPAFASDELLLVPSRPYIAVCLSQFALIPAAAVIFSYIQQWPRHTLKCASIMLAAGTLILPLAFVPLVAILLTFDYLRIYSDPFTLPALLPVFAIEIALGIRWIRKLRRRFVQIEAERWLAERRSGLSPNAIRSRTRAVRWSVCMPSLAVLFVFLFLLEFWGALSHILNAKADIPGYSVPIPISWYLSPHSWNQDKEISGLIGKGPARAFKQFPFLPLSWWDVRLSLSNAEQDRALEERWRTNVTVFGSRNIISGAGTFECVEAKLNQPYGFERGWVQSHCRLPGRLRSSFLGYSRDLESFYQMIGDIRANDP